jgi:hypothetical protein
MISMPSATLVRRCEEPWIRVALVEIIRTHAAHEQLVHEAFHDVGVVVHAAQQHALIAQRHAVVGQQAQTVAHLRGQLARMIGVDAQPERMVLLQHAAQLGGDALRQEDRHAAADADELDVLDRPQAGEQRVELGIGEEQGITAGEQHIAHLGVTFQVAEGGLEFGVQFLLAHAGDDAAARAVAAVARTAVRHEEEHAVRVAMHEARHGHVAVLAAGIAHLIGIFPGFLDARDDLPADRAAGIGGVHQVEIMRGDRHRQLVAGEQHAGAFLVGEREMLLQLLQRRDPVSELPGGVVPVGGGDVFIKPIARSVGAKLLLRQRGGVVHVLRVGKRRKG